jgi:hypothetical protein
MRSGEIVEDGVTERICDQPSIHSHDSWSIPSSISTTDQSRSRAHHRSITLVF